MHRRWRNICIRWPQAEPNPQNELHIFSSFSSRPSRLPERMNEWILHLGQCRHQFPSGKVLNLNLFLLQTLKKKLYRPWWQLFSVECLFVCLFLCIEVQTGIDRLAFLRWMIPKAVNHNSSNWEDTQGPDNFKHDDVLIQNTKLLTVWNSTLSLQIIPGGRSMHFTVLFSRFCWWRTLGVRRI